MKTNINKIITQKAEILRKISLLLIITTMTISCNDFLDVVPDNVANLDHAFNTKKDAENFLATLYGHAPNVDVVSNVLFTGADDAWTWYDNHYHYQSPWKIARGEQNTNNPFVNAWEGTNHMKSMFVGIRKCNIFIEEVSKSERLPELDDYTRRRWLSEAKFLKAYFHFYLFRMYGPIPITDVNIGMDADLGEVRAKRNTVDEVIDYLDKLLLEAARDLPIIIDKPIEEAGRVTKGAALTMRAKVLTTAASPLFNGNPDYEGYADSEGTLLFPQEYKIEKWEYAAKACEQALDSLAPSSELYRFTETASVSDETRKQLSFIGATTEAWNSELIWGRYVTKDNSIFIQHAMIPPKIDPTIKNGYSSSYLSITHSMVERYYSKNGVPIDEDKEWRFSERLELVVTDDSQPYNLQSNYKTAKLNIDRESRFYASLAFDGSKFYLKSVPGASDENSYNINSLFGQTNGVSGLQEYTTVSGYFVKKLTHWDLTITEQGVKGEFYPWPELRLTDLYLLAAECYNEIGERTLALHYIDQIRDRSGLEPVEEAWSKYSINPKKPESIDGLREIIYQEREIELAYEGERMWDIRRWKKAVEYMNRNVVGWTVTGKKAEDYYRPDILFEQRFIAPRDYLWPISINELRRNPSLVQNPGW